MNFTFYMKKILCFLIIEVSIAGRSQTPSTGDFKIVKTFHIASNGGWDYLAIGPNNKLYVSHGSQVNILDKNTGDSLGVIPNTTGVHGIAFDESSSKGFTSNGRINNVTVFDLNTNKELDHIATGENPDAILFDHFSKKIVTCNGRGKDLSIIDPVSMKVVATIPVGGKPETAVSDDAGNLYVNIEDKSEIVHINMKNFIVADHWSIAPGESPTGLAIDKNTKRLFAGCDKLLIVLNALNGKIIDKLIIGDGCDGVAFDNGTKNIYTSNGDGTLTVIKENNADSYAVTTNVLTKKGARTLSIDESSHTIYLPAADYEPRTPENQRPKTIPGTFQILVIKQ